MFVRGPDVNVLNEETRLTETKLGIVLELRACLGNPTAVRPHKIPCIGGASRGPGQVRYNGGEKTFLLPIVGTV